MGWGEKVKGRLLKMAPRAKSPQPTPITDQQLCVIAAGWFQLEIEEGETDLLLLVTRGTQKEELTEAGMAALSLFQEILRLKTEVRELKANQKTLVDTLNQMSKGPHGSD